MNEIQYFCCKTRGIGIDTILTEVEKATSGFMGKICDKAENMLLHSEDPYSANYCEGDYLYGCGVTDLRCAYA